MKHSGIGYVRVETGHDVLSDASGIYVTSTGSDRAISISTAAGYLVRGGNEYGIYAETTQGDINIISSSRIEARVSGIVAIGKKQVNITVDADILPTTKARSFSAISMGTDAGQTSTLDILAGTISTKGSGKAIINNEGDSRVNIANKAIVKGPIELGDGDDTLIIDGADISNISLFDGGDDADDADGFIDELTLKAIQANNVDPARFQNWERLRLDGGSVVHFASGTLQAGLVEVLGGNTMSFAGSQLTVEAASATMG